MCMSAQKLLKLKGGRHKTDYDVEVQDVIRHNNVVFALNLSDIIINDLPFE